VEEIYKGEKGQLGEFKKQKGNPKSISFPGRRPPSITVSLAGQPTAFSSPATRRSLPLSAKTALISSFFSQTRAASSTFPHLPFTRPFSLTQQNSLTLSFPSPGLSSIRPQQRPNNSSAVPLHPSCSLPSASLSGHLTDLQPAGQQQRLLPHQQRLFSLSVSAVATKAGAVSSSSPKHGCTRSSGLQPPASSTPSSAARSAIWRRKEQKTKGKKEDREQIWEGENEIKNHCLLRFLGFAGGVTSHRRCRRGEEEKTTQIHPSLRLCPRRRVVETRCHCSCSFRSLPLQFLNFLGVIYKFKIV